MKALITTVFLCASLGFAQNTAPANKPARPATSAHKTTATPGRSECAVAVELCVTVPASWQRLGDVFDDLGFVVAEQHPGTDASTWPQLTVAAIDMPSQKNGPPSLDSLVEIVLTPDGSFATSETLQRTHLLLNGADAEIVRVLLHDSEGKPEATEAIALIQGDDGLVYSIALRCAPQDFARLEPVFQKAAHSWHIKPSENTPQNTAPQTKTPQDLEKK